MVRARIMLCSSFLFTCSGAFGYHFGGLNEVPIGVMECRDSDRTSVHGILYDADEDIGRKMQPESARPRRRRALTGVLSYQNILSHRHRRVERMLMPYVHAHRQGRPPGWPNCARTVFGRSPILG